MAKKTIVELIDDISGESIADGAGRSLIFSLDGTDYEIDLSNSNIEDLRAALAPYINAGRRVTRSRGAGARRPARSPNELQQIREWAAENGFRVAERGRIAAEVVEAYAKR